MTALLICLLGGVGATARFVVDGVLRRRAATSFPVGTVTVNVTGSFLAGLLTGAALAGALGGPAVTAAVTGFCGGYTTFSTAMADTVRLARDGQVRDAVLNAVGTAALTVLAVLAGLAAAAPLF
ncbi:MULTISPECIES: CrcB family protein [Kocuria]|uniref:Fluoride-specific ion channel FluC n=1 Tax=Kocuria oceani TaxID=988827 RepID=A0ABV9TF12_9MICC|nr:MULTISPECIES: CrcB family protein [Kocuria]KLU11433.1 chromosome condensation protein CrcB [Kocuria sp. SM24M-10]OLT08064.1 chromosome condensation protein CrcB [Kocuria sp. CNJ-770]